MLIKRIDYFTIENVWAQKLWTNRSSAIEPISYMTWPFTGDPEPIDMSISQYDPTFWGVYQGDRLVGVNSGHRTNEFQYRSRGIWVEPDHRGKGISDMLFERTQYQAELEGCEMIWSIPRKTALAAYLRFGFQTVGDFFGTETSEANIYVRKLL